MSVFASGRPPPGDPETPQQPHRPRTGSVAAPTYVIRFPRHQREGYLQSVLALRGHTVLCEPAAAAPPKVHTDVPLSTNGHSLSDCFPADLLQGGSDSPARVPERNMSLGIMVGSGALRWASTAATVAQRVPASTRLRTLPRMRAREAYLGYNQTRL